MKRQLPRPFCRLAIFISLSIFNLSIPSPSTPICSPLIFYIFFFFQISCSCLCKNNFKSLFWKEKNKYRVVMIMSMWVLQPNWNWSRESSLSSKYGLHNRSSGLKMSIIHLQLWINKPNHLICTLSDYANMGPTTKWIIHGQPRGPFVFTYDHDLKFILFHNSCLFCPPL